MSEISDLVDHLERLATSQDESSEVLEEIADGLELLREWIAPRQRPKVALVRGEGTSDYEVPVLTPPVSGSPGPQRRELIQG